ncbi:uncharacterized protein TNCV_4983271 [Trichonephila clavipes]|nr:uncharacterized protein TNCV_4983271 [Trichonephila clavipes]
MTQPTKRRNCAHARHEYGIVRSPIRRITGMGVKYSRSDRNVPKSKPSFMSLIFIATVAEWYRYRINACLVTSSSPVPLKTHRVGQRCTLNLLRADTSSRWCGVVVRREGASSVIVLVT